MSVLCYILVPEGQADAVRHWAGTRPGQEALIPVVLVPGSWNDDLTPWPAGPVFRKGKPFGGKAEAYLDRLLSQEIPAIEQARGIVPDERWIAGVSLSGLFAVWAATRTDAFRRIASVSGSFWYPGFTDWLSGQAIYTQRACLSLGTAEDRGRNEQLRTISRETGRVAALLQGKGVPTRLTWTDGTHFSPLTPRLESALEALAAP